VAVTQDELYATLDLDLSWSEAELRERERTKHVHRLHPYHGKFIPQLVEVLLGRYFVPGDHVLDPFAGSGTTLVQALESGLDATGVDIAAFNCRRSASNTRGSLYQDAGNCGEACRKRAAEARSDMVLRTLSRKSNQPNPTTRDDYGFSAAPDRFAKSAARKDRVRPRRQKMLL